MTYKDRLIKAITHPTISSYIEEGKKGGGIDGFIEAFHIEKPDFYRCYKTTPISIDYYYRWRDKPRREQDMWRTRLSKLREFFTTY